MMELIELKKQIISDFRRFNPDKIILFGSVARADWDEGSDVDVIVVYETTKPFLERLKELYLSWSLPKAVDILAYTPTEFTKMSKTNFFIQAAVKEGESIYERK
jgi:predicted nucleotidyltransferase